MGKAGKCYHPVGYIEAGNQNAIYNAKLIAMGIHEQFYVWMASGPAPVKGAVNCTPKPGVSGPPLKLLLDKDGTEVIKPGTTGDNTGVGTWHVRACFATTETGITGNSGNTGG